MLKKYTKIITLVTQEGLQYRLNYITSFLCVIFPLFAVILLWKTIYADVDLIKGYTKSMMMSYYILSALIGDFVGVVIWWDITNDIRNGTLSNILLRPISYRIYNFAIIIGVNAIYSIFVLIIIIIFSIFFITNLFFPDIIHFLLFIPSLILSFVLSYELTYLLSLSAFWTKENTGFSYFTNFLIPIMVGSILPLDLFPFFIYRILEFLPFKYILYFPINIYLTKISFREISVGLFLQVLWILITHFIGEYVWKLGLKKYEAVGA